MRVIVILFFLVTFLPCGKVLSQQALPIKDFSVGNRFVYLHNNGLIEESVIGDTTIGTKRYGKVQIKAGTTIIGQPLFMRATDSALYQYLLSTNSEILLYRLGQRCTNTLLPWTSNVSSFCDANPRYSNNNNTLTYVEVANAINNSGLSFNGDATYQRHTTIVTKPFGLVLDSTTSCQIFGSRVDVPCHTTRPDPGCQPVVISSYKICTPAFTTVLLRSVVQGVEANMIDTGPYNVSLGFSRTVYYPESFRLQFLCTHSVTQRPAANYGIPSLSCRIPIDTNLVQILQVQTLNGSRPDSVTFSGNNAILHCTFSTKNDDSSFILLKPKAFTKDTNIHIAIERPVIPLSLISPINFVPISNRIALKRGSMALFVDGLDAQASIRNNVVEYGQEHSLEFAPMWLGALTRSLLPDSLSFMLSIDTTGLENIGFFEAATLRRIKEDSVGIRGNIKTFFCTAPTPPTFQKIGMVRFRSKAIFATQNTISILGTKSPPGFIFRTDYNLPNIFRQLGLLRQLPRDVALALNSGNNVIQSIAPNPARDELNVAYITSRPTESIGLELINTLGVVAFSIELPKHDVGRFEFPIAIHGLPNGMYFLRIRTNSSIETRPIIVSQ